jgi:hypothetical protein
MAAAMQTTVADEPLYRALLDAVPSVAEKSNFGSACADRQAEEDETGWRMIVRSRSGAVRRASPR